MAAKPSPEEIFDKAVEITDPKEQATFLDQACGGDEKLRAEVDVLLKWNQEAGSFLDVAGSDGTATLDSDAVPDASGTVIGRYKLLEKIGEGGMATVYMAEQKRPIRRRVALKIIKLGMDTKQVIGRFEAERQALAMMDHPNIAKVFDAGTTETGRPYFVMELVKGMAMTEFCDSNHLTTQERLDLFISVCQAVQHAHQRGIIHRDIKPTNVLVTLHDGKPVVKVIDFGIAKAVNQQLTEKTVFTRFSQMIGTPEYMSPEQAEMSGLDIDTRTDVFSLGVLLYELLTGTTPFDSEYLLSKGYNEMQRIIREEEPVRPSTKVSTLGDSLTEIAKHRRTSPDLLCKLIRSDLDWIVMKTIEKDRSRRYESVSELAADVQRHLDNETVLAGRPSAFYRIQKFVKRNKLLASSAVMITSVVVLAAIFSGVMAIRATNAREDAIEALGVAKQATTAETTQRQKAETLAKQQREDLYFNHIRLAHQTLEKNRPVHALELLDKCPEDLRNWEWHYLKRKSCFQETESIVFDAKVISFDFSPDGSRLAAFLTNGELVIQDPVTEGKSILEVRKNREFAEDYVIWLWKCVTFCPDGKHIAVIGDDYEIKLISLLSDETVQRFAGHSGSISQIVWAPDGSLLASVSENGTVCLWEIGKRDPLKVLKLDYKPSHVAFAEEGQDLIVCYFEGYAEVLRISDVLDGKKIQSTATELGCGPTSIAVSPDGRCIATGLWTGTILLSDSNYKELFRLEGHSDMVRAVAFNADGTRLASVSHDLTVRLWDVKTGRDVLTLEKMDSFMHNVAFDRVNDNLIVSNRTKNLQVFSPSPSPEPQDSRSIALKDHNSFISTVNYSPSGHQVVSSSWEGAIRFWNASNGEQESCIDDVATTINSQFSPDGLWITAACSQQGRFFIKVWEAQSPHKERFSVKFDRQLTATTFSYDNQFLFVGAEGGLHVYDWKENKKVGELGRHDVFIVDVTASADGKYLASTGFDGKVKIWDATSLHEFQEGHLIYDGGYTNFWVGFRPNSEQLAVGGREGEIVILDVESGETVLPIPKAHGGKVNCVAFSSNGKYLASCGSDRTVRIWETDTGKLVDVLRGHEDRLLSVDFSPDGKHVVSSGIEHEARIWTPRLD